MSALRLVDLDAQFRRWFAGGELEHIDTLAGAQAILFDCPKCFAANGGPVGTHRILIWFRDRGVPDAATPAPRWAVSGSSVADLTLSPSVDVRDEEHHEGGEHPTKLCGWHGFVTQGLASL